MPGRIALVLVLLLVLVPGCAGRAWRQARSEDSIAAYHAFLREHSDASFAEQARARLELARVRQHPSRERFERFRERYATPELLAELRPHVEETFFLGARAAGTAAAYRDFLEEFPDGSFADRARGNAVYLENAGYDGAISALSDFAAEHPASDFAAEAARSVAVLEARGETEFDRIGLLIEVSAETPGRERLARVLRDRVAAAYASASLHVIPLAGEDEASSAGVEALLEIRHDERAMRSEMKGSTVTRPGVLARTVVTLRRVDEPAPIWSDEFSYRAPLSARREGVSILFGPGSRSYWADLDGEFFVPVARWSTQRTLRDPWTFQKPATAVEVLGNRAVVAFGDGDFELLDLGDPAQPVRLGTYRRPRDLSRFEGVAIAGARVLVYGPDGAEVVALDGEKPRRLAAFGRDAIGSVVDVVPVADGWLAATNRGLVLLGATSGDARTLLPRPVAGIALASGGRIVLTDGVSLYTATLQQLLAGRVDAELRLGRGFNPQRVRVHGVGDSAVVLGARDAVWVDLRGPRPRLRSRIGGSEAGRVRDAAVVGNRLFLLGPRGLQVADASGERIVDSVDVQARERIDVSGRHLVMIGERALQVVDATPFLATAPAAQPR